MKNNTTPNALPSTILNLESEMGASLTLNGARQVDLITTLSIGDYGRRRVEKGIRYPYYMLDLNSISSGIIARSRKFYSKKNLRTAYRNVQRKLAIYLFENKSVTLKSIISEPRQGSILNEDSD